MKPQKSFIIIIITILLGGGSYFVLIPNSLQDNNQDINQATIPYDRNDYGRWSDDDKDCQNTRHEILIEASSIPVKFKTEKNCLVISGTWLGAYTNTSFNKTSQLDIDHIVPLKEAHISGASKWENKDKNQFFNDLDNLIPVSRSANRSKGSKDPGTWLPANKAFHCAYIQKWVAIKKKYDLDYDAKEQDAINNILKDC